MNTLKKTGHLLREIFCTHWNMLRTAITYYASLHVVFYTEVALIMLCCVDFTLTITLLNRQTFHRRNNIYWYMKWAIETRSTVDRLIHDNTFIALLIMYLMESVVRIYYCLKLAYHHHRKVTQGELCCMKCHDPLVSAAMPGVFIVPHFVTALCSIYFFTRANLWTAWETVGFQKKYFANSPFLGYGESEVMLHSVYYRMAEHVMTDLGQCRHNKTPSIKASVVSLLRTGDLLGLVDYKCTLNVMHCKYGGAYLQLAVESVQALVNYTVIRSLFNHVINMHQYEVYNLQTRLQTRGRSRLICVYKVKHKKTDRQSRTSTLMQLPRQALMSVVHLGTSMATRIRASTTRVSVAPGTNELAPGNPMVTPVENFPSQDDRVEQLLRIMDTDLDKSSWSRKAGDDHLDSAWEAHPWGPDVGEVVPAQPVEQMEQKQDQELKEPTPFKLYNRRDAAGKKRADFEYLRITNLFPTADGENNKRPQPEAVAEKPPPGYSPTVGFRKRSWRTQKGGQQPRVNDSIFTDETFYSLET